MINDEEEEEVDNHIRKLHQNMLMKNIAKQVDHPRNERLDLSHQLTKNSSS